MVKAFRRLKELGRLQWIGNTVTRRGQSCGSCGMHIDRSGIVTVEFAVIVPVFLALLFVIIEGANLYRVHSEMSAAARDASRRAAVSAMEHGAIRQMVLDRVGTVTSAEVTVTIFEQVVGEEDTDVTVEVGLDMMDALLFNYFKSSGEIDDDNDDVGAGHASTPRPPGDDHGDDDDDDLSGSGMRMQASSTMLKE